MVLYACLPSLPLTCSKHENLELHIENYITILIDRPRAVTVGDFYHRGKRTEHDYL